MGSRPPCTSIDSARKLLDASRSLLVSSFGSIRGAYHTMRRTALVTLATTVTLLSMLTAALAVACSGDDNGGEHGAVFGPDGGGGDATTFPSDGSFVQGDGSTDKDGSTILPDGGGCTAGTVAIVGGGASSSFASVATGTG